MPAPDHPSTPPPTGLPEPPSGVGSADLATDSTDPQELHALLERARERLAFYESFDRIIGENIRRSGELMVETAALREQARALAEQSTRDRAAFEAIRKADRDRYRALVQSALDEAASARPIIDGMVGKLRDVLARLDEPDTTAPDMPAAPDEPILTEPDAPEPATATEPAAEPAPEPAPATPRTIQVLAHQVPNAKTAIALQKMLRDLEVVTDVDAREFANGELRLAVVATDVLPQDALDAWVAEHGGKAFHASPAVLEITLTTAAKS